ncbi:MAG: hypothetical protein LBU73_09030 [Helicobacteraceae bacterium]|jgi:hypothetical protein|nr:hypothetical protein [Helicobacteraceae bacterium]
MQSDMLQVALIAVVGLILIVSFAAILWQLKSRFGAGTNSLPPIAPIKPAVKTPAANNASKTPPPSGKRHGSITIAHKTFEFYYKISDEAEAKKLLELIKQSIALMKESKYPDIAKSRAKESESLIRRLKSCTDLDEIKVSEIAEYFKESANALVASLK